MFTPPFYYYRQHKLDNIASATLFIQEAQAKDNSLRNFLVERVVCGYSKIVLEFFNRYCHAQFDRVHPSDRLAGITDWIQNVQWTVEATISVDFSPDLQFTLSSHIYALFLPC
jgi:hypothetical protein